MRESLAPDAILHRNPTVAVEAVAILRGPRYVVRPGNHTRDRQEGGGRRDGGSAQERLDNGGGCRGYRGRARVLREDGRHAGGERTRLPGQGAVGGAFQASDEGVPGHADVGRRGPARAADQGSSARGRWLADHG